VASDRHSTSIRGSPTPSEIAVVVEVHIATLRGTVGSFRQRRGAVSDARNVDRDYDAHDPLKVRLLAEWQREDVEIRAMALQVLGWDAEVPPSRSTSRSSTAGAASTPRSPPARACRLTC
jgi:hypothetical protein